MIKGTTPTHTFILPFDVTNIKECQIIYGQNDTEVFKKTLSDCVAAEKTLKVTLTQKDTLKLNHTLNVQIQVRVLTVEDKALSTRVAIYPVHKCLNDEVIGNAD